MTGLTFPVRFQLSNRKKKVVFYLFIPPEVKLQPSMLRLSITCLNFATDKKKSRVYGADPPNKKRAEFLEDNCEVPKTED